MEIEELTKSQIVLLVLLVSFMTSIATGIVTVSLLAQAPPAVTQTVNRVIERTVETVVPAEGQTASVVKKETTVVVKEDDLITESIDAGFERVVRIHKTQATSTPIVALGAIIGDGTVITDLSVVTGAHAVSIEGETYQYELSASIKEAGIAILSATGTAPTTEAFTSVGVSSLKLGQTLIGLYGTTIDRIAMSTLSGKATLTIVNDESNTPSSDEEKKDTGSPIRSINATVDAAMTPGAPLITVFGELVGISTEVSREEGKGTFVAVSDISALLSKSAEAARKKNETASTTAQQ
ncbi:MAG: hypothetical protein ACJKTH_02415 [Patescibacteria group bacterium UBA2163]